MITGATKTKVDEIWQRMWEGGITNPLEVITQLTYLMFMRQLDDRELEIERNEALGIGGQRHLFPATPEGQRMRWSHFKDYKADVMHQLITDEVFPFIRELGDSTAFSSTMRDATFTIQSPKTLERAVTGIDGLLSTCDIADLGDLYEYMLSKLETSKMNGQFRTPRHIREMMVSMVNPRPGERVCDPACGTAGFLISAAEYIRSEYGNEMNDAEWAAFTGVAADGEPVIPQFSGFETDSTMLRISAMNLLLHSVDAPDVRYLDSVSKQNTVNSTYDVMLANPPFKGSVDAEDVDDGLLAICDSRKTELLFVALFIRMLRLGGRCACIVPNGVLSNESARAYGQLRRELVDNQRLQAVIHMPSGVFRPYSGVSTAILLFTKSDAGGTDDVWMYRMDGDGFTLDDRRSPDSEHDDIPDVLARWSDLDAERGRERTEKSFLVPVQEIRDNGYDLSFNKYAKMVYSRVDYPPTETILLEIEAANRRIAEGLAELKQLLDGETNA